MCPMLDLFACLPAAASVIGCRSANHRRGCRSRPSACISLQAEGRERGGGSRGGEKVETDICCRTHDHCAHVIHPFAYRYGYRSFLWHTISHCQCDNIFKECLRRVNDTTSRVVGQAFFNVIKVPCFEFQYKNLCVERYWYGQCKKYSNESVAVPKESGLYDFGGELIDQVSNSRDQYHTNTPALELSPEKPTLGQIVQATEDLLKLMITVSPGTSSDTSKLEETNKRKDKKKKEKKGRKHKKGKGLKGKRKGQFHDVKSGKDFWGEGIIKNDDKLLEQVLQLESKQEDFNDVLNDEPITNTAPTQYLSTIHTTSYKESKNILQSHSPFPKPFTEKPQKRNRQGKNGRQRKKKKSQTGSSVSDILN
ncbi:hypothetical protein GDO86_009171 [Hymenochirus boettgeri]|uniref:Phospholipase A2-like central domain-containing protein n=1 Tax=Hymenochirus boettgeri TaxID=247094 RepID=A0A8T2JK68_9PIPI|nr:hypothetical protein GDO86_009171 [Hymenochirus boettgeri]